jgi:glycosyltransferase involved in cell wall biosynthesis
MKFYFSVITPSYNRRGEIQALVRSLENQTLSKKIFEVLIVDDGSTDGTAEWVTNFKKNSALNVKLIHQDHKGPGVARNTGMREAKGDIYVFIDSDCTAPPNWLEEIKSVFDQDPLCQAFGGRDDATKDFPPLLKAINYTMTSFLFTGGMRGGKKHRLAKFYPRSFNMGVRREWVDKIGFFNELRHGQDIEFSHRIMKSGARIAYIPQAVVFHKRRTSLTKFFRQVFNWGVARINLYMIDRHMLEPLHFAPAIAFWIVVAVTVIAFLVKPFYVTYKIFICFCLCVLVITSVHAGIRWRSVMTGLLIPLVTVMQVSGYGLGFSFAFFQRVIRRKGEFTGFVKKYY